MPPQGTSEGHDEPPRKPVTPEQIDRWVEHSITQAQRRGDFDNLPGAGKPLASLEGPVEPDWWLRGLIQREKLDLSAALPGPMALRRERATYPEALADIADEPRVQAILEDFNERVLADRRRPVATVHSPAVVGRIDVEEMLRRWRALRAEVAPAQDSPIPDTEEKDVSARRRTARQWLRWRSG